MDRPDQAQLSRFLRDKMGLSFCESCVALAVKLSLQQTREALSGLGEFSDFKVSPGQCSSCGREKSVILASRSS